MSPVTANDCVPDGDATPNATPFAVTVQARPVTLLARQTLAVAQ